jgi:hypothetical protein
VTTLNLAALSLQPPAEDRWLGECYVYPAIFSAVLDARSTLVSAPAGHGKTALAVMARRALDREWLNVEYAWQNQDAGLAGLGQDLLKKLADEMWTYIERRPASLAGLGTRLQAVRYFLDQAKGADLADYLIGRLADDDLADAEPIRRLAGLPHLSLFTEQSTLPQRLDVLCDCVQKLGARGMLVWIDLPARGQRPVSAASALSALFDAPALARRRFLHFKCLAEPEAVAQLKEMSSVVTGSVEVLELSWRREELIEIADRRLVAAGSGRRLGELVDPADVGRNLSRLSDAGSPAEWLALAAQVAAQAAAKGMVPLDQDAWLKAQREYSRARVRLRMDDEGFFWLGPRRVADLTPAKKALYPLAKHLYENPGFHKSYQLARVLDAIPSSQRRSRSKEPTLTSESTVYIYIKRIRELLQDTLGSREGDADHVYLITAPPGLEGYALVHTDRAP